MNESSSFLFFFFSFSFLFPKSLFGLLRGLHEQAGVLRRRERQAEGL